MKDIPEMIWFWFTIVAIVLSWGLGFSKGGKCEQEDAIKAGVAYYTNNAAGESVFKWKECK